MSMTPQEAAFENWLDQFSADIYPEHRELAIEEFIEERMQSFYTTNPQVAVPALNVLTESKILLPKHPSASLIFAATAIEVGLKDVS